MLPPHAYPEPATIRIDPEFLTIDVNLKTKWGGRQKSELPDLPRSDPAPSRQTRPLQAQLGTEIAFNKESVKAYSFIA
jgi:hypothetical protein